MRTDTTFDNSTSQAFQSLKSQNILYQDNFAARMVELEMTIELSDFTVGTLQTLMDYYSQAVDYFVLVESSNYIYFKNKIKSLLLKPKVISVVNGKSAETMPEPIEKPESKLTSIEQLPCLKVIASKPSHEFYYKMENFQLNKDLSAAHHQKQITSLVDNYIQGHTIKENVIVSSLMNQKNCLRKRLEERKNNSGIKSIQKSGISIDKHIFDSNSRLEFASHQIIKGKSLAKRHNNQNLTSFGNVYGDRNDLLLKNMTMITNRKSYRANSDAQKENIGPHVNDQQTSN
jgi:hypothetical protein